MNTLANKWSGAACYLNGKTAKITGRLNQFATVVALDGTFVAEFAWETVDRIMNRDRKFSL